MTEPLLRIEDLHVTFSTRRGLVEAVRGVTLSLGEGEMLGLVGESGSGKSVTGFATTRLLDAAGRVTAGRVLFRGQDITKISDGDFRVLHGAAMSMIFQNPRAALNPIRAVGRFVDVLMAFPLFVLAMAMVAALGNRVENIVIATAIINLPFYIRFARAEVNVRRNVGWVEAARACGDSHISVVLRFLLPNVLPAMAVQMSLNLGWAILNAAGLSFIGLGVKPPTPEWGIMVAEGARFISTGRWWLVAFPGLALMLAVLCFNLLGDGMRDILDPRMRT